MKREANSAVSILNATANGYGCSLAINARASASWTWEGQDLVWEGETDDRLVTALWQRLCERAPHRGARVDCSTPFPPARGLKTSSSASVAMLRAAMADARWTDDVLPEGFQGTCIAAAQEAGITLTGAFDDQVAVALGGCHLTDNGARTVIASIPIEPWHVAVWVPEASIPKRSITDIDATTVATYCQDARRALQAGRIAEAMTLNGRAFTALYQQAGLPVTSEPADVALAAGALGAGLSGTGPAVAALFDDPVTLRDVPGGTWLWFRAQGAA